MNRRLIVCALILSAILLLIPQNARSALCIASGAGRQLMHHCAKCIGTIPSAARRRRCTAPQRAQRIEQSASSVDRIALMRIPALIIPSQQNPRIIAPGANEQRRGTNHFGVVVLGVVVVWGLRIHLVVVGGIGADVMMTCADVMIPDTAVACVQICRSKESINM